MGDMESLLRDSYKRHQIECPICPYVFDFEGKQIGDFRKSWATAFALCAVPRSVAMRITGHKTESMYLRYAGVRNSRDLQDAARKVQAYRDSREPVQNPVQTGST
jgi:hypothetical protein